MSPFEDEYTYLGLDFSTQQLKAVVINNKFQPIHEAIVQFDEDLPEFRTQGGVHKNEETKEVTCPPLLWIKALDLVLERLKISGLDFLTVAAVSGCAQQHGSVYWRKGAREALKNLKGNNFLHVQLQGCFSVSESPVWMDASSTAWCRRLETSVGGPQALADITGSRAFERFTGNQIAKIFDTRPEAYKITERISVISGFAASLFLGDYAAIDYSDGSGLNLLDITTKNWSEKCLQACAPDLKEKLGDVVPSTTVLGTVSPYFVERYGFSPECKVIPFTGDNPGSLIGMALKEGDVCVSLGTSDTIFLWLKEPHPSITGHIFINPLDPDAFMGMICYKNGSLTRERIRNECVEGSWDLFDELLNSTPSGNFGNIGMYFDFNEIIPEVIGDFRFNKFNNEVTSFSKEVEVRAVVEGQFLAKRLHAENLGFKIDKNTRILATGGASCNKNILQVLSNVFNAKIYVQKLKNSGSLGGAYLAKIAADGATPEAVENMFNCSCDLQLAAEPSQISADVYNSMLIRYKKLEEIIVQSKKN